MELIYNLTTHFCRHDDVETEPRIEIMCDPRNFTEVIKSVKKVSHRIPRKARVLVGGHVQIVSLFLQIAKIKQWQVYNYSTYDDKLYPAVFLSRMDRLEIERDE